MLTPPPVCEIIAPCAAIPGCSVTDLNALLTEAKANQAMPGGVPKAWPSPAPQAIQKLHYTHDAMIDLIIANPAIHQNELAARFGYTASWVSTLMATDAFQNRLAERTKELVDPAIRASVEEQFKGMVLRSLDILRQKLDKPAADIPDNLALRTLELSSRALGYGARVETPPTQVGVSVEVHLEQMGDNLVKLLQRKKAETGEPILDAEIVSDSPELASR